VVGRAFREWERRRTLFDLPAAAFYRPRPGIDLRSKVWGQPAANPLGPAPGPHTQMAANIVTAYLAGARVFEWKSIRVSPRASAGRPSLEVGDAARFLDSGQDLGLEDMRREFVGASMLIDLLRETGVLDRATGGDTFAAADCVFDLSLQGDRRGLENPRLVAFVRACQDARGVVEELRARIPADLGIPAAVAFRTEIIRSATLLPPPRTSPADVEALATYVVRDLGLDVAIKLRPAALGFERCTLLLQESLGREAPALRREAFDGEPTLEDLAPVLRTLQARAQARGGQFSVKLLSALPVEGDTRRLPETAQWLAGRPLHVLALEALADLRDLVGPELPVSISAGIDADNVARAIACGAVAVTSCTDLLRPGGVARMGLQLTALETELERTGVRTLGDFVLRAEAEGEAAVRQAVGELHTELARALAAASGERRAALETQAKEFAATLERRGCDAVRGSPFQDVRAAVSAVWRTRPEPLRAVLRPERERDDMEALYQRMVQLAGARNVPRIAAAARAQASSPRTGTPPVAKQDSRLSLWDCTSCDRCIPACPNDANFVYEVLPVDLEMRDWAWRQGGLESRPAGRLTIQRAHQLATVADLCNECGNCDTACPESGGPFAEKPRFFVHLDAWRADTRRGFHVRQGTHPAIWGRFEDGSEHLLQWNPAANTMLFKSGSLEVEIDPPTHQPLVQRGPESGTADTDWIPMARYHVLRTLLEGVTDLCRVHWVNGGRT